MPVSSRLRYEVLRRDGFACHYCHRSDLPLTVDHVVASALGGADAPENLVAACEQCNSGKSATTTTAELVAEVDSRAQEWAGAMRRAAEIQGERIDRVAAYCEAFDALWKQWTYQDGTTIARPPGWATTVAGWHNAGLELSVLDDLAHQVLPRKIPDDRMFPYYCGAVRNVLSERQAIAQALLQAEASANGMARGP